VEIAPQNVILPDNPTSSHTIRIEMQWTPTNIPGAALGYVLPCQAASSTGFLTGGNLIYQVENVTQGSHQFQFRFNIPCGNPPTVFGQYQLYFDDQLVQSNSFSVGGCYNGTAFPFYNFSYTPPLVSNYFPDLSNDESCMLTSTSMVISTYNDCTSGISWNRNTQPVNLTFISGGEFASFYDENQQNIGDSFSGTFSEFQNINIIQDSVYRGSENKYFIIQCEWGGIVRTDSVRITTQTGDIVVVTSDVDSIYSGHELDAGINLNDAGGQCTIFFPYSVTYNAEIIEGNQYGGLYDYNTGQTVQSIPELFHYFGQSGFNYVADGISADSVSRVVIRIGTSMPTVPYTDFTLYIKSPPIYAYTVPEVLGANEVADVIIKKKNPDGTLEDFPPEQTFELAVLDGCVNGNFMVGDSIDVYFADALQPIKFVTADSLDSEVDSVLIRVGTDIEEYMRPTGNIKGEEEKQLTEKQKGIDTLRAGFEKMIAEKKADAETKEGGEPMFPVVTYCADDETTYPTYYNLGVSLESGCGNLDDCIGVPYPEFVQSKMISSGGNNPDVCTPNTIDPVTGNIQFQAGGFTALDWRPDVSQRISAEPCFDSENNNVQFNMVLTDVETNQNSPILKPEAILEVCEDNITSAGVILVNSTEQLLNIIRQFPEQIPIIKSDMDSNLSRYNAGIIKYKFRQEILVHESEHKKDYESYLTSLKTEWLDRKVMDYFLTCEQFNLDPDATEYAKIKYQSIVIEYINEANTAANEHINEITLHQRPSVQASLADYYILLYNYENGIIF